MHAIAIASNSLLRYVCSTYGPKLLAQQSRGEDDDDEEEMIECLQRTDPAGLAFSDFLNALYNTIEQSTIEIKIL
jgi:hypothetical protein